MSSLDQAREDVIDSVKLDVLDKLHETVNEKFRRSISGNFVSDTITVPTKEMQSYAACASLGDDVYHEPATAALEAHVAKITGKDAGLFLPSGTMSNQVALRAHLKQPPYSVVLDHRAHIYKYEAGGAAFHSGAQLIAVMPPNRHHLTLEDVEKNVNLENDLHSPPTELIALENTLNGTIIPQEEVIAISKFAHDKGIKMHLDGARIWHVAAETGTSLSVLCEPFDSVSLCFSKGLGAPVGTCLVGTKEFIAKGRWLRKLFGGGMRQTGMLAGSAAYALTHNFPKLPAVHALAKKLQSELEALGATILSPAETCMLFYDPSPLGIDYAEIAKRASELEEPLTLGGSRLVVHIQTTEKAVDSFLSIIKDLAAEKVAAGFVPQQPVKPMTNGEYKDVYVRKRF